MCIILNSLFIVCSCHSQENNQTSYIPYSAEEITEIQEKIVTDFGVAYWQAYELDISKELPFSIAQGALFFSVLNKNIIEIDRALFFGADINFIYLEIMDASYTPLFLTIWIGANRNDNEYFMLFKYLVSKGANVESVDKVNNSALMIAIEFGNMEVYKYLMGKKVDINHRNKNNENALLEATSTANICVVKELLEAGIEVNLRSTNYLSPGMTCLDLAIGKRDQEIISILKKYGAKTGEELDAEAGK